MVQLIRVSFHQTNESESLNVLSIYKQIFSAKWDNQVKMNPTISQMNAPPVCLSFTRQLGEKHSCETEAVIIVRFAPPDT